MKQITTQTLTELGPQLNPDIDLHSSDHLTESEKKSATRRIYRNLIVFSISTMLFNSSQKGIDYLQTSLNSSNNLGVYIHIVYSGVSALFCFFLPMISMKLLGYKWTVVVNHIIATSYIIGSYFKYTYTLLPAAALHGIANVVLHSVHGSLVASLAKDYLSLHPKQHKGQTFIKFFAINGVFVHFSHLIGSGVSALVFNIKNIAPLNVTSIGNVSSLDEIDVRRVCGATSCPNNLSPDHEPANQEMIHLTIIYLVIALLGILIPMIFLDNLKPKADEIGTIKHGLKENFRIFANINMLLFIPIYFFIGSLNSFISFDLSVNYLSCKYGIGILGNFFLIIAISSMISSALITQVAKIVNKTIVISLIIVLLIGVFVYLAFWTDETSVFFMYGLAGFLGLSEATWGTFLNGIIGVVFYNKPTIAYTSFRFVLSLTSLVSYVYSMFVCTYLKIFILVGLAIVSFLCIITIDVVFRYKQKRRINKIVAPIIAETKI